MHPTRASGSALPGCAQTVASSPVATSRTRLFGLTLCAECGLVSALVAGGRGRLVAIAVTAGDGRPLAPCGRCRQLLIEHAGPALLVDSGPGAAPRRLGDLLPGAFDGTELEARRHC